MTESELYRETQKAQARSLGFKRLLPINTDLFPEECVEELWAAVRVADYAFEDTTRDNKVLFAAGMLMPGTYNFEIPGEVFAQLVGAYPGSNAQVHFITLTSGPTAPLVDAAAELFDFAFDKLKVNRVTAFIPSFNQKVIRMAGLARMKFEGNMRRAFLYNGEWWDVNIFGLLAHERQRRG